MEVVSENGARIRINPGQTMELGRSNGLNSSDKTISRRHLSLFIPRKSNNQGTSLQFEVLGRNPIYVSKGNEVKIFRRFERGEMGNGDMFCVSAKNHVWYTVRKIANGGEGVRRNDLESELPGGLESGFGFKDVDLLHPDDIDISGVDPVKEFGFLVEGHEFDSYPKKLIKDFKNWDWYLEEEGNDSEENDDEGKKGKTQGRRKRKKGTENDDDEWTGESEDDKMLISKSRKGQRPKYKTRSNDTAKPSRNTSKKGPTGAKNRDADDEEDDEDEEDETLGGFIVDDEDLGEEEDIGEVEEDEEEEEEELGVDEVEDDDE